MADFRRDLLALIEDEKLVKKYDGYIEEVENRMKTHDDRFNDMEWDDWIKVNEEDELYWYAMQQIREDLDQDCKERRKNMRGLALNAIADPQIKWGMTVNSEEEFDFVKALTTYGFKKPILLPEDMNADVKRRISEQAQQLGLKCPRAHPDLNLGDAEEQAQRNLNYQKSICRSSSWSMQQESP